jgi:hypothetical protein
MSTGEKILVKTAILDVDGVLLDPAPALAEYCKDNYGKLITEEFITAWDWGYCLGIDVEPELWEHIWETPATPYDGADRLLEGLRNFGYRIILLSARPTVWRGLKNEGAAREAAVRDFKQLDHDEVVLVNNGKEKWSTINWMVERDGTTPDFMLEDHPTYAKLIGENTPVKSYLLTRPWNQNVVSLTRSWERIINYNDLLRQLA